MCITVPMFVPSLDSILFQLPKADNHRLKRSTKSELDVEGTHLLRRWHRHSQLQLLEWVMTHRRREVC